MRYSSVIPFAVAVAAACHDGPTAPAVSELLGRGHSGSTALTATQTAVGLWEQRTEYDWTAQRFVQEIHVGSDMHLIPERDRVQILPGETVWITFQVDAQRHVASEGAVKGVRGQTCVTNSGASPAEGVSILEHVELKTGSSWAAVAGATTVVSSPATVERGASLCLPYEILFSAEAGAAYRVVATVTTNRTGTGASALAGFALPNEKASVEIDAEAWVRDAWFDACLAAFGLDFSCMSPETFPRDRLLKPNAAGHASVSFMVDVRNDGVCEDTFVYRIDAPLREGGPGPAGGESRSVSGSLIITTGHCEDTCPQSVEWWAGRFQSHTQEMLALLPFALGLVHGEKTVGVATEDLMRGVFARFGEPSNGIYELYAQLLAAKLNIKAGVDPRPIRDVRIAVETFLAGHHATQWPSLTAQERALVAEWIEALKRFNERRCDSDGDGANCTRTIGYWKNHAGFGPQNDEVTPLLPVWLGTAGGSQSVHVTTAALAVELLNKNDDASNGINKLYAQLLAAKLNIKHGADGSAVAQTIAQADAFLGANASGAWNGLSSSDRQRVLAWAATLDDYNNGRIGPGHCD